MTGGLLRRFVRRSTRFPGFRPRTGRRFLTVRMDTTNRCNLRCSMCPMRLSDGDPDRRWTDMDAGLFDRIVRQVFPIARTVGLSCGAEPFCNSDFPHYLEALYRADVPVREVVTNGTLMGEAEMDALVRTPPTSLFISIDGASRETHSKIRGGADLEGILDSVRLLVRKRDLASGRFPMVSFSMTLQKSNLEELPEVVRTAAEVGARSVGVVPLVPYEGLGVADQVLDMASGEVGSVMERSGRIARELGVELVTAHPESRSGGACAYPHGWLFIDPEGRVDPCPYWDTSRPLGDLSRQSFEAIWRGEAYEGLRRSLARGELTGNCSICPVMSSGSDELKKT